jgi:hypothetical protein
MDNNFYMYAIDILLGTTVKCIYTIPDIHCLFYLSFTQEQITVQASHHFTIITIFKD